MVIPLVLDVDLTFISRNPSPRPSPRRITRSPLFCRAARWVAIRKSSTASFSRSNPVRPKGSFIRITDFPERGHCASTFAVQGVISTLASLYVSFFLKLDESNSLTKHATIFNLLISQSLRVKDRKVLVLRCEHFLSDYCERCRAAEEDRVHSGEHEHALQRGNRGRREYKSAHSQAMRFDRVSLENLYFLKLFIQMFHKTYLILRTQLQR